MSLYWIVLECLGLNVWVCCPSCWLEFPKTLLKELWDWAQSSTISEIAPHIILSFFPVCTVLNIDNYKTKILISSKKHFRCSMSCNIKYAAKIQFFMWKALQSHNYTAFYLFVCTHVQLCTLASVWVHVPVHITVETRSTLSSWPLSF